LRWCKRSIGISKRIGDQVGLATIYYNIGVLYLHIGKKDIAKQYLQESYKLYLQFNLKSEADEVKQFIDEIR